MDNHLLNIILKTTYTLSQYKKKIKALNASLSGKFFQGNKQIEDLSPKDSDWLKNLSQEFLDSFTKDNLSTLITSLNSQIDKMPILTIYLPFEASEEILDQIGLKARSNFGAHFLIDIKYNPLLIAGCALSWKGIYKDYSLHQKITERRLPIMQSFKKFLR